MLRDESAKTSALLQLSLSIIKCDRFSTNRYVDLLPSKETFSYILKYQNPGKGPYILFIVSSKRYDLRTFTKG
ncbi:hypothetical protein AA0242T_0863 [Acetobacter aceti NRIC 0242]|uniref:Uncharacterized protein n=1 Tax=Acetobacter aceti TaxID=435 RepID=A0A6S6PJU1_ACEAC|nr:hypothetical protein AAJCM20276_22270 [Acetobacter aceti]GAN55999.1 hypothetical protein Abac_002_148 [Acetobacter aceti NBRC 14818]GBO80161.1 hypothetical protein AA0242T_0863 [Acetobacter aceti NRIC 0242]